MFHRSGTRNGPSSNHCSAHGSTFAFFCWPLSKRKHMEGVFLDGVEFDFCCTKLTGGKKEDPNPKKKINVDVFKDKRGFCLQEWHILFF
jgi:hypothetical protein